MSPNKETLNFKRDEIITFSKQIKNINERLEYFLYVFGEVKTIQSILKRKFFYNFVVNNVITKNPSLTSSTPHVSDYLGQDNVSSMDMITFNEWIHNVGNTYLEKSYLALIEPEVTPKYDRFLKLEADLINRMDNLRAIISVEINHIRELMRLKNHDIYDSPEYTRDNF